MVRQWLLSVLTANSYFVKQDIHQLGRFNHSLIYILQSMLYMRSINNLMSI